MAAVRLAFNYAVGGVLGATVVLAAMFAAFLLVTLAIDLLNERWGE